MAKKAGLGRGLGELLGEIEEAYDNELPSRYEILDIDLSSIKANPYQPRKSFDEKALHELSESIKENGLIQPVVVVDEIDGYILVAGERRLRASKLAKTKTIKSIVISATTDQMRSNALIENIQREELNAIELANAYSGLVELHGYTHDDLSAKISKSRTHVTNTLRLLKLCSNAQKALIEKKLTAGHAKILVNVDEKEQKLLVNSILGQKLSVRDTEKMVSNFKKSAYIPETSTPKEEMDFNEIKNRLYDIGLKTSSSKNKLTISFDNSEALTSFLKYFS